MKEPYADREVSISTAVSSEFLAAAAASSKQAVSKAVSRAKIMAALVAQYRQYAQCEKVLYMNVKGTPAVNDALGRICTIRQW